MLAHALRLATCLQLTALCSVTADGQGLRGHEHEKPCRGFYPPWPFFSSSFCPNPRKQIAAAASTSCMCFKISNADRSSEQVALEEWLLTSDNGSKSMSARDRRTVISPRPLTRPSAIPLVFEIRCSNTIWHVMNERRMFSSCRISSSSMRTTTCRKRPESALSCPASSRAAGSFAR